MESLAPLFGKILVVGGAGLSALTGAAQISPVPNAGPAPTSVVAGSGAGAESSAARLEQLRHALIDQALDAPVHVTANAWLDESGRLRHVSRFFSEVRARAASELIASSDSAAEARATAVVAGPAQAADRVLSGPGADARERVGAPSAVSRVDQSSAAPSQPVPASAAESSVRNADAIECRQDPSGLRRLAMLRFELMPVDGARGHSVLNQMQHLIQQVFLRQSGQGGLTVAGSDAPGGDSYSRLISSTGRQDSPYRIEVRISSDRLNVDPVGKGVAPGQSHIALSLASVRRVLTEFEQPSAVVMPDRRVDVDFSLVELSGERTVIRHRLPVLVPGGSPTHNTPALPDSTISAVSVAALAWWAEAVSRLRCEPLWVQAQPMPAGALSIPVGGVAGIRVGDRWMIADHAKIPARVLEPGAIDRMMMAEVVAVGQHRSTLRLTAESIGSPVRPGLERGVPWFASPL